MNDSGSARQCFLVEWYQPDLVDSAVDTVIDRLTRVAAAARVKLLLTLTAPSDETLFGVFTADSVDAVVAVCRQAGWHVDRITAGVRARIDATED